MSKSVNTGHQERGPDERSQYGAAQSRLDRIKESNPLDRNDRGMSRNQSVKFRNFESQNSFHQDRRERGNFSGSVRQKSFHEAERQKSHYNERRDRAPRPNQDNRRRFQDDTPRTSQRPYQNERNQNSSYHRNEKPQGDRKPFQRSAGSEPVNNPSSEELLVRITYPVSKTDFYVIEEKDTAMNKKFDELERKPLSPPFKFGRRCLSVFEGVGCRVQIINEKPLKVRYIDYGNEKMIEPNELYELSLEGRKIVPLAFKIKLTKPCDNLYEDSVVRIKKIGDGLYELCEGTSKSESRSRVDCDVKNDKPGTSAPSESKSKPKEVEGVRSSPVKDIVSEAFLPDDSTIPVNEPKNDVILDTKSEESRSKIECEVRTSAPSESKIKPKEVEVVQSSPVSDIISEAFLPDDSTTPVNEPIDTKSEESRSRVECEVKIDNRETSVPSGSKIEHKEVEVVPPSPIEDTVVEASLPNDSTTAVNDPEDDATLDTEIEAIVTYSSETDHYVVKKVDLPTMQEIDALKREPMKSSPKLNCPYLSEFESVGSRVEVIRLEPLTVRYIDYGNEGVIQKNNLYELPSEWRKLNPLAFRISVPNSASCLEENSSIRIKKGDDGCWKLCEEISGSEPSLSETMPSEDQVIDSVSNNGQEAVADTSNDIENSHVEVAPASPTNDLVNDTEVAVASESENSIKESEERNTPHNQIEVESASHDDLANKDLADTCSDLKNLPVAPEEDAVDESDVAVAPESGMSLNESMPSSDCRENIPDDEVDLNSAPNDDVINEAPANACDPKNFKIGDAPASSKKTAVKDSDVAVAPELGERLNVTIEDFGRISGAGLVFRVIRTEKSAEYEELINNWEEECYDFQSCDGSYKVGSLYALERNTRMYRVRVICDCPTLVDFIDDSPVLTDDVKIFDDIFEKEELYEMTPKYAREDLVPFSIPFSQSISPQIGAEIIIKPTKVLGLNFWDVEVLDGGFAYTWDEEEKPSEPIELIETKGGEQDVIHEEEEDVIHEEEGELVACSDDEGDIRDVPHGNFRSSRIEEKGKPMTFSDNEDNTKDVTPENVQSFRIEEEEEEEFLTPPDVLLNEAEEGKEEFATPNDSDPDLLVNIEPGSKNVEPIECQFNKDVEWFENDFQISEAKKFVLPHTFDTVSKRESITFVPGVSFGKTCATGLFVPSRLTKDFLRFNKRMDSLAPDPNYRPEVGEMVVASKDKLDAAKLRAIVLRKPDPLFPKYSVFHLDVGNVEKYDPGSFSRLPSDSPNPPGTATICSVVNENSESLGDGIELNLKYRIEVDTIDQELGICKGSMIESSAQFDVVLEKLDRPRKGDLLDYVPLKTGDTVSILPFKESNKIYIRPKDNNNIARRFEILDLVNLKTSQVPLEKDPLPHDLVAVSHRNSLWRAEVLRKIDDSFDVVLIDKGHHIDVTRAEMRSLPEDLKTPLRCAVPVKLKGVRTIEVNERNTDFKKFINKEHDFELVIEEDSTVTLKFLNGVIYGIKDSFRATHKFTTANEYIEYSLLPFWLGCLKIDAYYYPDVCTTKDLRYCPKDWEVGKTYSLHVAAIGDEYRISVCNKTGISYDIFVDMEVENRLQEYGKYITDPYRCEVDEVCIAKSKKGVWGRAQCLLSEPGEPSILLFLDTGAIEVVHHTDIRRCEKEFIGYSPIAVLLTLTNAKTVNVKELLDYECKFKIVSEKEIELVDELDSE